MSLTRRSVSSRARVGVLCLALGVSALGALPSAAEEFAPERVTLEQRGQVRETVGDEKRAGR